MKMSLEPGDRQFLEQVHRLGSGTVGELCAEIGVTATAVRQRLARLQGLGFVARQTVRSGRGRPHYAYSVTEAGQRQLGDNYEDLAQILWRELQRIEETEVRTRIVNRVRDSLIERYGRFVRGDSLGERLTQLQEALAERGFSVEVDGSGSLPVLRENNCPYHGLASADPSICELEQEVFQRVLQSPVVLTQCCLDGHSCCEFRAG